MSKLRNNLFPIIVILGIITLFGALVFRIHEDTKETRYCGYVVNIYPTPAGYKVRSERHVVFYNDSLKRNIDVRVTNQQYVNTKLGQHICFDLTQGQLEE